MPGWAHHIRVDQVRGRLLVIFAPIIALLAATGGLVLAALFADSYRSEMFSAAAVVAVIALLLSIFLLYSQVRRRQATGRALQDAEARVSDIVESAMDPVIAVDQDQRVILFNAAAEKSFLWSRAAVLGEPLDKLIPQRFRSGHRAHIEAFGATGVTSRRMGSQMFLVALRADGEEFPIEASISQHTEEGKKLFTVILRDVTERVRAEEALRRSKEELQELGAAAHQAREQEKSRIARELHDELAQALTALQMDVAWCKEKIPPGEDGFEKKLERMEALLNTTVTSTRRIAADLRPLMLDDLGLLPAVEWLVENFTQRTGVACELAVSISDLNLHKTHSTAVFRIVQESLANIAKHARASQAEVAIAQNGSEVTIAVRDDGLGFSPQDPRKPNSFGLVGLRERAYLLGGEAAIISAPGRGTDIEVRLPLPAQPTRQ
jgi:PAS domain S-box-containing protein